MCGICGAFSFGNTDFVGDLRPLVSLMARRGPDDEGQWHDYPYCGLGFRRLSIQDLSTLGHQPMLTADHRYALVFNGELYDFKLLRKELEQKGYAFRSSGDTEVVLNALAHWGESALGRFNGMFALAFYDLKAKTLLLARDHAGIKPLYYLHVNEGVVFASQYNQLLAHRASKTLTVNTGALGLYLQQGFIPSPYAILERTHMLKSGSWIRFGLDGSVQEEAFFSFPASRTPDLSGAEVNEALDEAITAAVKSQLVSDVPVGTFLSGGIDSPLITAKAFSLKGDAIKAFTIGTQGDQFDESCDAEHYARQIGVRHEIEQITPQQSIALLDNVVEACGEPFGDYSIFPTMLISQVARREVKVMLSGDGGDELFWGYANRFGPLIRHSETFKRSLLIRKAHWGLKKYFNIGSAFQQLTWPTAADWFRSKQTLLHDDALRQIFPEPIRLPDEYSFAFTGNDRRSVAQSMRNIEYNGRMQNILLKVDRASMYSSLEVRVPLLDRRVVDVASRIDWSSCINIKKEVGKLPLRALLKRHVQHQTMAKRGFTVPMGRWLLGPLKETFEDNVLACDSLIGVPINRSAIQRKFKDLENGGSGAWGLWLLLSLALWEKKHLNIRY